MCLDIHEYPILFVVVDGDYIAIPTDFYGYIIGDGKTPEEAMESLKLAIREWEDLADEKGLDIPLPCSVSWEEFKPVLKTILGNNLSGIEYGAN